jgi:hypothetical protein
MRCRIPSKCNKNIVTYVPNEIIRREGSGFFLPPVSGMREPGTNYISILTSKGVQMVDPFDPFDSSQYTP